METENKDRILPGGFNVTQELKKLPASPGVYIMHDVNDTLIYVGKAVNLTQDRQDGQPDKTF